MDLNFNHPEAYHHYIGRWSELLAIPFLEFADVKDGDLILDAGSGTGSLASAIHSSKPNCKLFGIDIVESYVDYARQHYPYPGFRYEVGSITKIPAENNSFDKSLALLVINFLDRPIDGVLEMRRVTKAGGTVAACVWNYGAGIPMVDLFVESAQAVDPDASSHLAFPNYLLSKKGKLKALWEEAGLVEVKENLLEISMHFSNFDDFWLPFLGGATPLSSFTRSLSEEKRMMLRENLKTRLLKNGADAPFTLPAQAWGVKGLKE